MYYKRHKKFLINIRPVKPSVNLGQSPFNPQVPSMSQFKNLLFVILGNNQLFLWAPISLSTFSKLLTKQYILPIKEHNQSFKNARGSFICLLYFDKVESPFWASLKASAARTLNFPVAITEPLVWPHSFLHPAELQPPLLPPPQMKGVTPVVCSLAAHCDFFNLPRMGLIGGKSQVVPQQKWQFWWTLLDQHPLLSLPTSTVNVQWQ